MHLAFITTDSFSDSVVLRYCHGSYSTSSGITINLASNHQSKYESTTEREMEEMPYLDLNSQSQQPRIIATDSLCPSYLSQHESLNSSTAVS
jgi:hypothetical protein